MIRTIIHRYRAACEEAQRRGTAFDALMDAMTPEDFRAYTALPWDFAETLKTVPVDEALKAIREYHLAVAGQMIDAYRQDLSYLEER